jgi:hypothetical protein
MCLCACGVSGECVGCVHPKLYLIKKERGSMCGTHLPEPWEFVARAVPLQFLRVEDCSAWGSHMEDYNAWCSHGWIAESSRVRHVWPRGCLLLALCGVGPAWEADRWRVPLAG